MTTAPLALPWVRGVSVDGLALVVSLGIFAALWLLLVWVLERQRKLADKHLASLLDTPPLILRRWRAVRYALLLLAFLLLAVVLSNPTVKDHDQGDRGLDIAIAFDVSKSMLVSDVAPTRIAQAKAAILALLQSPALVGDRVAAIAYAGTAVHMPLQFDKQVIADYVAEMSTVDLPPGSSVAPALRIARCILRPERDMEGCAYVGGRGDGGGPIADIDRGLEAFKRSRHARVLLVFSDSGGIDDATLQEAALLKEAGIAVYWIGIGTAAGGFVPDIDQNGKVLTSHLEKNQAALDETILTRAAQMSGTSSKYRNLANYTRGERIDGEQIARLFASQQRVPWPRTKSGRPVDRDISELFLLAALLLLVLERILTEAKVKEVLS